MQVFRLLARRRLTQTTIASISLVAATLALSPASAFAAPAPLVVVQPQAADAQTSRTYGEWSALWWQTMLKLTNDRSPVLDTAGRNCSLGDTPDMFFLAGNAGGAVARTCSVPTGKPLFIPILNTECSTIEAPPFFGRNDDELHACARALIDGVDPRTLSATLDGVPVADLARFRAPSPVYGFSMPAENNCMVAAAAQAHFISAEHAASLTRLSTLL
jgi:hypothetical protein